MQSVLFILGTTRSGTSALRNAIALTRFNGPGEGHTIGLLGAVTDAIDGYFEKHQAALSEGTQLAVWQKEVFRDEIIFAYRSQLERAFPVDNYLDKTPNITPLKYLDLIQSALPAPRFIFCRRRGIDNVISKARKWPETPFYIHCEEWRDILELWDEKKSTIICPWMEVEYYDLAVDPSGVAEQVGSFLRLPDNETAIVAKSFGDRPNSATGDEWPSIDQVGWSDDQKKTFLDICGPAMERCGYGYYQYWRSRAS